MTRFPHDLSLPDWGPYADTFAGLSHIAAPDKGWRFDVSVFPSLYRTVPQPPRTDRSTSYRALAASPDGEMYTFRHFPSAGDRLYCDITCFRAAENDYRIRCECVNGTNIPHELTLHALAALRFPDIHPVVPRLPGNTVWIEAMQYESFEPAEKRPHDSLVPDGLALGEVRGSGFVKGSALGTRFGFSPGDKLTYRFTVPEEMAHADLLFRYQLPEGAETIVKLEGMVDRQVVFSGRGQPVMKIVRLDRRIKGPCSFSISFRQGDQIILDGFAVIEQRNLKQIQLVPEEREPVPALSFRPGEHGLQLAYPSLDHVYGLAWQLPHARLRQLRTDNPERALARSFGPDGQAEYDDGGKSHYTSLALEPLEIRPGSSVITFLSVTAAPPAQADISRNAFTENPERHEFDFQSAYARLISFSPVPAGEPYRSCQETLAATLVTNVVYPAYCKKRYVRHRTTAADGHRRLTWQAGFTGLGMLELDPGQAREMLLAWLTAADDHQSAFIHRGPLLPMHIHLFHEIWNRTADTALLEEAYPGLRQYHRFLAGRLGSSTTRMPGSGMLRPWDYGPDAGSGPDYPAQARVRGNGLTGSVTPVVTTALAAVSARILLAAARQLGYDRDIEEFTRDIAAFGTALQNHSWDEESGYFEYVVHDGDGNPADILRLDDEAGTSCNRGLEGALPLVTGICTENQKERILERLQSPDHLWTTWGLTAVERSAPYYDEYGLYNGTVRMHYQWLIWKALLDIGEMDLAFNIARTALEVFRNECDATGRCPAYFSIRSGCGAGWPRTAGPSAVLLNWFSAYYLPGRFSGGYGVWVTSLEWTDDHTGLTAELEIAGGAGDLTGIMAVMDPTHEYRVFWNGTEFPFNRTLDATLVIYLPGEAGTGTLEIRRV